MQQNTIDVKTMIIHCPCSDLGIAHSQMHSISESFSQSVSTSISLSLSFFSASVKQEYRHTIATSMTHALTITEERSCSAACPDSTRLHLFQWITKSEDYCAYGERCAFTVYTCHFWCRSNSSSPMCPHTACADLNCDVCLEWQEE